MMQAPGTLPGLLIIIHQSERQPLFVSPLVNSCTIIMSVSQGDTQGMNSAASAAAVEFY